MDHRTRILDAALRVFAETGYRGATTRRIAQEADVNEVTLFRHFGSKEELIRAAMQHAGEEDKVPTLPEVPEDPERELVAWAKQQYQRLRLRSAVIRTCMGEHEEHPELGEAASTSPRRVAADLKRYLTAVRDGAGKGHDFDVDAATRMLMGALFTDAISRDVMPDLFEGSAAQAPVRYVKLLLRAIRP